MAVTLSTLVVAIAFYHYANIFNSGPTRSASSTASTSGQVRVIRNTAERIQWFHDLFSTPDALGADTDSEIISYEAVREQSFGYSVVEFRQTLTVGEHTATFECVATTIWKKTNRAWREARWHGSVISSEIPDELRELSERAA